MSITLKIILPIPQFLDDFIYKVRYTSICTRILIYSYCTCRIFVKISYCCHGQITMRWVILSRNHRLMPNAQHCTDFSYFSEDKHQIHSHRAIAHEKTPECPFGRIISIYENNTNFNTWSIHILLLLYLLSIQCTSEWSAKNVKSNSVRVSTKKLVFSSLLSSIRKKRNSHRELQ